MKESQPPKNGASRIAPRSIGEVISTIPFETAKRHGVLPKEITDDGVVVFFARRPNDLRCTDELRALCQFRFSLISAAGHDLDAEIDKAYRFDERIAKLSDQFLAQEKTVAPTTETVSDDSPAAEIIEKLLARAVSERASDVHIEPGESGSWVRFRIDGRLTDVLTVPGEMLSPLTARLKILARLDIAQKRKPQDGRIIWKHDGRQIDIRVSTLPSVRGEKTVLRLLDPEQFGFGLESIGCGEDDLQKIKVLLRVPHGLILNTGPTGSGKTTTLYAMLRQLDIQQYNAVAVEDPVEYHIEGVTQVQVNEAVGLTFATALRSILRQDPDIILVGEIRDSETAKLAVRAALTGHLVLATVHANDAPSAPSRLIDMGVQPYMLSAVLRGVLAQRLIRRLCPDCRRPYHPNAELAKALKISPESVIYAPVGCLNCGGRGYKGRTGIFEVMAVDDELASAVGRCALPSELSAIARRKGMKTLEQSALEKVASGETSLEEVGFVADFAQ